MFKKTLFLAVFFVIMMSSSIGKIKVLKVEQMVPVLVDLHMLQVVSSWQTDTKAARNQFNKYATKIFCRHATDAITFQQSLTFHAKDLEKMNDIYKAVIRLLRRKKYKWNE